MKKANMAVLALMLVLLAVSIQAQPIKLPAVSPYGEVGQKVGETDVIITYSHPAVNGREIWGGLVPYGKVWRTGANMATSIDFSTDVKVNGSLVKAGSYGLFTIPGEEEWTVILNDPNQWGAFQYDESKDVLRFKVEPVSLDHHVERFVFVIEPTSKTSAKVAFAWGNLAVPFDVESHTSDPESDAVRVSPSTMTLGRIGVTDVTIMYGSPAVNGREIWGGLVPYGEVWRTGANEATTIEFQTDVTVEGNEVKAGKYALFTIPGEDEWTFILNSEPKQWGAYKYDKSKDVLRFTVKPEENDHSHKRMRFHFKDMTEESAIIELEWAKLKAGFDVKTDIIETTYPVLAEGLKMYDENPSSRMRPMAYTMAVGFAAKHKAYLDDAKEWVKVALEEENWFAHKTAAELYIATGENETALDHIDKARDLGEGNPFFGDEAIAELDRLEEKAKM